MVFGSIRAIDMKGISLHMLGFYRFAVALNRSHLHIKNRSNLLEFCVFQLFFFLFCYWFVYANFMGSTVQLDASYDRVSFLFLLLLLEFI